MFPTLACTRIHFALLISTCILYAELWLYDFTYHIARMHADKPTNLHSHSLNSVKQTQITAAVNRRLVTCTLYKYVFI